MSLITIIIVLIVIGVVLQLVKSYVEPKLYTAAIVLIILAVCVLILNAFGVGPELRLR